MRSLTGTPRKRNRDAVWGLLFVAVPVLSVLVFVFIPAILSMYVSLLKWNGFISIGNAEFVGLDNFASILTPDGFYAKEFGSSLFVTIIMMLYIPFNIAIAFLLAFALNSRKMRLKRTLRLFYFLPFVSSAVAITLVFKNLFEAGGVINSLLGFFGMEPVSWLQAPGPARVVIIVMLVWRNIGYTMLMYLAGLQGIDAEVYEAARIDGAGVWKTITRITLPALTNITFFLVVTNVISGLQIYTESAILFQSSMGKGPMNGTESMMIFLMSLYNGNNLGMSSAISWAITLLVLFATFGQFVFKRMRLTDE